MPRTEQSTPMNAIDRLGLRVSAMIQGPIAQLNRRVTLFQLDSDPDYAWQAILELLQETDGISLERHEDGTVTVRWEAGGPAPEAEEGRDELELVDGKTAF